MTTAPTLPKADSPSTGSAWLALDIGGANVKAAHSGGQARTQPFELWKRPEELPRVLSSLATAFPPADHVAVTMTAELCDCFSTKSDGVRRVLGAVQSALTDASISVWGIDGTFHSVDEVHERPALAAAANWLALATLAARLLPDGPGLVIDIGSTTTDLIPTLDGVPRPRGRTDTERLRTGELVYVGILRTPICAVATELDWRGGLIGLCAELFASTLDVYLLLGKLAEEPWNHSTADGRPRTVEAARDRLARMVGADRESFSESDAREFAAAVEGRLLDRLEAAALRACGETGRPAHVVVAGSGEFLALRLAERLCGNCSGIRELDEEWGPTASSAACAHALVVLASERSGGAVR